ncbi:MAG: DUF3822 family protein [Tannerella sp.]|jgi:hypothetical protein|nr:DUF3822 family protein [Tannerella sp.]
MTLRVPYTLTADAADNYKVSIRLWSDGLSFSGFIPKNKDSFFIDTVLFDGNLPLSESLKNVFFENEFLSFFYKSIHVVCVSNKFTLVPDVVFSEKHKETLFDICQKPDKALSIIPHYIKRLNSMLLFGFDRATCEFLTRSLVSPIFVHSLSQLLNLWQQESLMSHLKHVHVVLGNMTTFEIVCFEMGELLFINSFDYETSNDVLYFIMYVCKQTGFNQINDCLYLYGDKAKCRSMMPLLNEYIEQVEYLKPTSTMYNIPANRDIYPETVALTECEL